MILLLNECLLLLFLIQSKQFFLLGLKKKTMQENLKDYEYCINIALDNAKKRINLLNSFDKKSVIEEYKEWIKDGLSKHSVLLLREDPII